MLTKSPLEMTNLEVRETIAREVKAALQDHGLMDLFGQNPEFKVYSCAGGDVIVEIDYGSGRRYDLKITQRRWPLAGWMHEVK